MILEVLEFGRDLSFIYLAGFLDWKSSFESIFPFCGGLSVGIWIEFRRLWGLNEVCDVSRIGKI